MTPAKPPKSSVVECQAGGKLNNLCGFTPNGDLAARVVKNTSSTQTNSFGLWDLDTGKLTASARLDAHYSSLLAISPDAQFLAIGATEGLCIASMATGGKVLELRARPRRQRVLAFSAVVFSPDSTRVAFRISNVPYGDRDDYFGTADLRMLSPSAGSTNESPSETSAGPGTR